jgi:hypothetical protein
MPKTCTTLLTILLTLLSASLAAAPIAYSINSDSGTVDEDSLYRIDLATGASTRVASLTPEKLDVEGLAFAPDGTLYAIDDESLTLFTLDPNTAVAGTPKLISGLSVRSQNDFGMTFGCDGTLYITSVAEKTLFRLELTGAATPIGPLGVNISAIAAYGNPTRLYGLGNGLDGDQVTDSPGLYQIDIDTGAASLIGKFSAAVLPYTEGGLDFDEAGMLWGVTDRRIPDNAPSQVMRIDTQTAAVSENRILNEIGFESLAIASPGGCDPGSEPPPPPPPPPPPVRDPDGFVPVPALSPSGLAALAILLLLGGLIATRRL